MVETAQLESDSDYQDMIGAFNVNEVRANSSLPKDAWEQLDDLVVEEAEGQLNGVQDLRDEGLVVDLDNMGVTDHQYEQTNKFTDANTSISGQAQDQGDDTTFNTVSNPVPVVFKDFTMSKRRIMASERNGIPVDDENAASAARSVARKLEDMLFNGDSSIQIGSNAVEGYTSQGDVIDITSSTGGDWGGTPTNIFDDKNLFIENLQTQTDANSDTVGFMGPYWMYLSNTQWTETKVADPEGDGNLTARERLTNDAEIAAVQFTQALSDGTAVVVDPQRQVVDMSLAQDITTITMDEDEFSLDMRTFAVAAPRIKSTQNGNSGVCKATDL